MRTDPFRALGRTSAALLAALVLAPVAEAAPKQKRYGIEGEIVRYDEAAKDPDAATPDFEHFLRYAEI